MPELASGERRRDASEEVDIDTPARGRAQGAASRLTSGPDARRHERDSRHERPCAATLSTSGVFRLPGGRSPSGVNHAPGRMWARRVRQVEGIDMSKCSKIASPVAGPPWATPASPRCCARLSQRRSTRTTRISLRPRVCTGCAGRTTTAVSTSRTAASAAVAGRAGIALGNAPGPGGPSDTGRHVRIGERAGHRPCWSCTTPVGRPRF